MGIKETLLTLLDEGREKYTEICESYPVCSGCPFVEEDACRDSIIVSHLISNGVTIRGLSSER